MSPKGIRVAVLGASGIGRIHVREFYRAGAEVTAILGSTPLSAQATAERLHKEFSLPSLLQPYADFGNLLISGIHAVSICTPWELHFEQLKRALEHDLYVFCEKPLHWKASISAIEIDNVCRYVQQHAYERLSVNTSNAYFIDLYRQYLGSSDYIQSFEFTFCTTGRHTYENIGVDLLPHGLSLLLKLCPDGEIAGVKNSIKKHSFITQFTFSNIDTVFHFHENSGCTKAFHFKINDLTFTRVPEIVNGQYRVSLFCEELQETIPANDPFAVYIQNFLGHILSGKDFSSEVQTSIKILKLMRKILL